MSPKSLAGIITRLGNNSDGMEDEGEEEDE